MKNDPAHDHSHYGSDKPLPSKRNQKEVEEGSSPSTSSDEEVLSIPLEGHPQGVDLFPASLRSSESLQEELSKLSFPIRDESSALKLIGLVPEMLSGLSSENFYGRVRIVTLHNSLLRKGADEELELPETLHSKVKEVVEIVSKRLSTPEENFKLRVFSLPHPETEEQFSLFLSRAHRDKILTDEPFSTPQENHSIECVVHSVPGQYEIVDRYGLGASEASDKVVYFVRNDDSVQREFEQAKSKEKRQERRVFLSTILGTFFVVTGIVATYAALKLTYKNYFSGRLPWSRRKTFPVPELGDLSDKTPPTSLPLKAPVSSEQLMKAANDGEQETLKVRELLKFTHSYLQAVQSRGLRGLEVTLANRFPSSAFHYQYQQPSPLELASQELKKRQEKAAPLLRKPKSTTGILGDLSKLTLFPTTPLERKPSPFSSLGAPLKPPSQTALDFKNTLSGLPTEQLQKGLSYLDNVERKLQAGLDRYTEFHERVQKDVYSPTVTFLKTIQGETPFEREEWSENYWSEIQAPYIKLKHFSEYSFRNLRRELVDALKILRYLQEELNGELSKRKGDVV